MKQTYIQTQFTENREKLFTASIVITNSHKQNKLSYIQALILKKKQLFKHVPNRLSYPTKVK